MSTHPKKNKPVTQTFTTTYSQLIIQLVPSVSLKMYPNLSFFGVAALVSSQLACAIPVNHTKTWADHTYTSPRLNYSTPTSRTETYHDPDPTIMHFPPGCSTMICAGRTNTSPTLVHPGTRPSTTHTSTNTSPYGLPPPSPTALGRSLTLHQSPPHTTISGRDTFLSEPTPYIGSGGLVFPESGLEEDDDASELFQAYIPPATLRFKLCIRHCQVIEDSEEKQACLSKCVE